MLPTERKENFLDKIINFFKNIFESKNKTPINQEEHHAENKIEIDAENYVPQYKTIDNVEGNEFAESLKVKDKSYIIFLQQKLKSNEIRVEDLSDEELDEMIALYKTQLQVA